MVDCMFLVLSSWWVLMSEQDVWADSLLGYVQDARVWHIWHDWYLNTLVVMYCRAIIWVVTHYTDVMQTANLQKWWSSTNVHSTFIFTIYDCSDPVGNLRPKNVVCRNSKFFVKKSQIVNKDSRKTKFIYDLFTSVIDWSWTSAVFHLYSWRE